MALIGFKPKDATRLQDALIAVYRTPAAFEDLLLRVGQDFQRLTVVGSNYAQNVLAVVQTAAAQDWILPLIAEARKEVPNDPELLNIQQELTALAPPQGVDHFDMCRLSGSHVMVNRFQLRSALREISRPLGKRILVIKGNEKTGKSHSFQLIAYLKEVRGNFDLRFIDLQKLYQESGSSKPLEPLPLAQRLSRLFKTWFVLQDPPTDAQWANWVLRFSTDFEDYALQHTQPMWIVIDSFNNVPLMQPTFDIIKQLALSINGTLSHLRLVLLGYTETLPGPALPHVEEESIEPISPEHLVRFFEDAYQQMRIPLPDATELEDKVLRLLEKVDPAKSDFLSRLGPLASEELSKASGPGGTNG